ncbi:protein of unknown function DUF39 [Desulfatibacillum aliphaticivorans]|uniref:Homocysteine biosynthesis enzyme sulfur-incorporation domain-containing protein n=1 Tax=Desulfatibacillum aliphaticivorans TaxID=218208 RepID=B8F9X2_DESAL|nr:homocysteine biosynthesis protein [Desulfatibacillum aliphaticivorans]ACL03068.1 protein of unknown function DUF39 [Desulfatibacillum aliphaticivorans]
MSEFKVNKTYAEINEKIKSGKVVVVTAEEMVDIVKENGPIEAAREVDVVTTGTFAPMCSSGAFINFGHSKPGIKASKTWLNNVPAYAGIAAVDCYIGATEPCEEDPLNRVHPGEFNYGGGHVIHDLIAGEEVHLLATAYGTQCYPNRRVEKMVTLKDLPYAVLCNPRNAYQNYACAINMSTKTVYTYMGVLKPRASNANYSTSGQLSPLFNDPLCKTIGIGTKIFLGGGTGWVSFQGTQYNPNVESTPMGAPVRPARTLMLTGDMKTMNPKFVVGVSILGYGPSLSMGVGIPIPILNEEMAAYTGVGNDDLFTQILDYGNDYPTGNAKSLQQVSYAELMSGTIRFQGKDVPTSPLSSIVMAREICDILKTQITEGEFLITEPQGMLP